MRFQLRELAPGDGDVVQGLLQAQRRFSRAADRRLRGDDFCAQVQRTTDRLADGSMCGWLANLDGEPVAYLAAYGANSPPGGGEADFGPLAGKTGRIATLEWAVVRKDVARPALYTLYTQAARTLLERGIPGHRTACTASPGRLLDTWLDLGFARDGALVLAPLEALPTAPSKRPVGLRVRRATPKDLATLADFLQRLSDWHTDLPIGHSPDADEVARDRAAVERQLQKPSCAHFLGELDGEPVGWCGATLGEPPEAWAADLLESSCAYLSVAYVLPRFHGLGIGQTLSAAVYDWVRNETNATALYTDFATPNPAGSRFWPAQGFRPLRYFLLRTWDPVYASARD